MKETTKAIRETPKSRTREYSREYHREYRKRNMRRFYETQIKYMMKKLAELDTDSSENDTLSAK